MATPGVALVHDYLLTMRGAERTFAAIADCWDRAPIYTTLYSAEGTERRFAGHEVHASRLQRLGIRQRGFRLMLPLYPRAVERLPVQQHEVLISSSSAFAHGIRPRPGAMHICYCHTPFRYVWHEHDLALREVPTVTRPMVRRTLARIRRWDLAASTRVTHYVANSALTRRRIEDFYGREASVIHPPVDTDGLAPGVPEGYVLVVGELTRHKRVHVALEAARLARLPIKVVGSGPERKRLEERFGTTARFLGRVSDMELRDLYARALVFVVPNVEEFGIAAVEAQAAGRPVVGIDAGGTRETVIDGETGILVPEGTAKAFAEVLREVDFQGFSPATIRRHAERFSRASFTRRFTAEVARLSATAGRHL